MKAFIDEEAEAEDGSDNDLMGFSDSSLSNDIVIYILARPQMLMDDRITLDLNQKLV